MMPEVADGMNNLEKVVFSRTLNEVSWKNTRLVKSGLVDEVKKMKNEPGEGMVILGSGTIVSQLTDARLIDEYQLIFNPLVLGDGRTLFEGLKEKVTLKRTKTRTFQNGNVVMSYEPQT